MRYLPHFIVASMLAACSAPSREDQYGVDSVSPEGDSLKTYSEVNMLNHASDHDLLISMTKLVFLGKGVDQAVLADDVAAVFRGLNGQVDAELKAGTLFYHPAARLMEFGGGVLWDVNVTGDLQLEAETVSWDMTTGNFLGEGAIRLFGPKAIIEGKSIVFDFFMNVYRIDAVQGVYNYEQAVLQE